MDQRLKDLTLNRPADNKNVTGVEAYFQCTLPADYRQFMSDCDGGEGVVGNQYLVLWRMGELVAFNNEYEVEEYAPGLLLFGSNGGDEGFAFDTRNNSMRIVVAPLIGMSFEDAVLCADSFENFLSNLSDGIPFAW